MASWLAAFLVFDAAAAAALLALAAVHRPRGGTELAEAVGAALGAGVLAVAVLLHGGHLGLPRRAGPGPAALGSVGAAVYLAGIWRALRRRGDGEGP